MLCSKCQYKISNISDPQLFSPVVWPLHRILDLGIKGKGRVIVHGSRFASILQRRPLHSSKYRAPGPGIGGAGMHIVWTVRVTKALTMAERITDTQLERQILFTIIVGNLMEAERNTAAKIHPVGKYRLVSVQERFNRSQEPVCISLLCVRGGSSNTGRRCICICKFGGGLKKAFRQTITRVSLLSNLHKTTIESSYEQKLVRSYFSYDPSCSIQNYYVYTYEHNFSSRLLYYIEQQ